MASSKWPTRQTKSFNRSRGAGRLCEQPTFAALVSWSRVRPELRFWLPRICWKTILAKDPISLAAGQRRHTNALDGAQANPSACQSWPAHWHCSFSPAVTWSARFDGSAAQGSIAQHLHRSWQLGFPREATQEGLPRLDSLVTRPFKLSEAAVTTF
jgi:hypothetical protein